MRDSAPAGSQEKTNRPVSNGAICGHFWPPIDLGRLLALPRGDEATVGGEEGSRETDGGDEDKPDEPQYFGEVRDGEIIGSVDGVRLAVESRRETGLGRWALDEAMDAVGVSLGAKVCTRYANEGNKPGSYRNMWRFELAPGAVVAVGTCLVGGKNDVRPQVGFVDFNPNKATASPLFLPLWRAIRGACESRRLNRWDAAVDYPLARSRLHVLRDRRNYAFMSSMGQAPGTVTGAGGQFYMLYEAHGVTEYLGVKNSPGRVKVYDKQVEAGLSRPLTRVELTLGGDEDAERMLTRWPRVAVLDAPAEAPTLGKNATEAQLLTLLASFGVPIEPYIAGLERKKRQRMRKAIQRGTPLLARPTRLLLELRREAEFWANDRLALAEHNLRPRAQRRAEALAAEKAMRALEEREKAK